MSDDTLDSGRLVHPPDVLTKVTIHNEAGERHLRVHGKVTSEFRKCERRRQVVLFKPQPGADRKVSGKQTQTHLRDGHGEWAVTKSSLELQPGWHRLYAVVKRKVVGHTRPPTGFVCRADRSETKRVFVR